MVILTIGFDQARLTLLADVGNDRSSRLMRGFRQDTPAVFGHEDQMRMELEYAMSACAKIV